MRDIYIILQEPRGIVHRIVNNQGGWRVKGEVDREGKVGKGFLFFFFFFAATINIVILDRQIG